MARSSERELLRDRKHASLDDHGANDGNAILCLRDDHTVIALTLELAHKLAPPATFDAVTMPTQETEQRILT